MLPRMHRVRTLRVLIMCHLNRHVLPSLTLRRCPLRLQRRYPRRLLILLLTSLLDRARNLLLDLTTKSLRVIIISHHLHRRPNFHHNLRMHQARATNIIRTTTSNNSLSSSMDYRL
jgi:hypothetical protein